MLARAFGFSCIMFTGVLHAAESNIFTPLFLKLTIDGQPRQEIYRCYKDIKGSIWLNVKDINSLKFPEKNFKLKQFHNSFYFNLSEYEQIEYSLDEHQLILRIQTPLEWHKNQIAVTAITLNNSTYRPKDMGAFLNYDLSSRFSQLQNRNYTAALTEAGLFTPAGVGINSILFNGYDFLRRQHQWTRLDSTWFLDQPETMTSWRLGDSMTSALPWNGVMRFAGIQYSTNFATQPTLITFPQPAVQGEAVLPSSVDVLINGVKAYHENIERGPFYLTQLPVVTGAGQIKMLATDLLGRQQVNTFDYYSSPTLLKPGLANFSYELGISRTFYGIDSNRYNRPLAVATYSLGLNKYYTVGGHIELLKDQQTLSCSNEFLLGNMGIASLGFSGSLVSGKNKWLSKQYQRGVGGLFNLGFRRQTLFLSYGFQSTFATHDYMQIGTYRHRAYPNFTLQSFIGLNSQRFGSLALTYTELNNSFNGLKILPYEFLRPNSDVLMVNYNKTLFKNLFLNATILSDLKNRDKQLIFSLVMPFDGGDKSLSVNEYVFGNQHQENIQLLKNLPFGNGYGYRLTAATTDSAPVIGDLYWQNNYGLLGARYFRLNGTNNTELNARGSVIGFAHRLFLTRYVDQSFALVHTPNMQNVDVYYRNLLIGKTNKYGYLYIPQLLPYQSNEIRIDPNKLSMNSSIEEVEQTVVPYNRSGVLVKFAIKNSISLLITLKTVAGNPIPTSAEVILDNDSKFVPVGYNGEVFVTLDSKSFISGKAAWDNQVCYFSSPVPKTQKVINRMSLVCA